LFLWDLGYFKVQALAHIAAARAYFLTEVLQSKLDGV
jgi:hypothetical protein